MSSRYSTRETLSSAWDIQRLAQKDAGIAVVLSAIALSLLVWDHLQFLPEEIALYTRRRYAAFQHNSHQLQPLTICSFVFVCLRYASLVSLTTFFLASAVPSLHSRCDLLVLLFHSSVILVVLASGILHAFRLAALWGWDTGKFSVRPAFGVVLGLQVITVVTWVIVTPYQRPSWNALSPPPSTLPLGTSCIIMASSPSLWTSTTYIASTLSSLTIFFLSLWKCVRSHTIISTNSGMTMVNRACLVHMAILAVSGTACLCVYVINPPMAILHASTGASIVGGTSMRRFVTPFFVLLSTTMGSRVFLNLRLHQQTLAMARQVGFGFQGTLGGLGLVSGGDERNPSVVGASAVEFGAIAGDEKGQDADVKYFPRESTISPSSEGPSICGEETTGAQVNKLKLRTLSFGHGRQKRPRSLTVSLSGRSNPFRIESGGEPEFDPPLTPLGMTMMHMPIPATRSPSFRSVPSSVTPVPSGVGLSLPSPISFPSHLNASRRSSVLLAPSPNLTLGYDSEMAHTGHSANVSLSESPGMGGSATVAFPSPGGQGHGHGHGSSGQGGMVSPTPGTAGPLPSSAHTISTLSTLTAFPGPASGPSSPTSPHGVGYSVPAKFSPVRRQAISTSSGVQPYVYASSTISSPLPAYTSTPTPVASTSQPGVYGSQSHLDIHLNRTLRSIPTHLSMDNLKAAKRKTSMSFGGLRKIQLKRSPSVASQEETFGEKTRRRLRLASGGISLGSQNQSGQSGVAGSVYGWKDRDGSDVYPVPLSRGLDAHELKSGWDDI